MTLLKKLAFVCVHALTNQIDLFGSSSSWLIGIYISALSEKKQRVRVRNSKSL